MQRLESTPTLTPYEQRAARRVHLRARRRFLWGGLFVAAVILAALISLSFYIDHLP